MGFFDGKAQPTPAPAAMDRHHDQSGHLNASAARRAAKVNDDINVLALVKGKERYIFLFDDSQRAETLRTLGRYASNSELSFTWYDAAVLSQKVRQTGPVGKQFQRTTMPQSTDE
tara:strand:- start:18 stop:362 length:345 start_codon:yes stop_codon:yes gene_type:complete